MSRPIQLTNIANNQDLIYELNKYARGKLSVVMFTASWCNPCTNIKREIYNSKGEGICNDYENIVFFYVDIEKNAELASEYEVTNIPYFQFLLCDGKNIEFLADKLNSGSKDRLIDRIEESLKALV
jgi:thiol-disulfide isomerase/thioredoxin